MLYVITLKYMFTGCDPSPTMAFAVNLFADYGLFKLF